ncbi:MAG: hypothetical protein EZS28_007228, partial [Streblomastix strix]
AMDQQSQGNGGHFLRSSVFRNTLRTIGNEGNSDKIGQLFDSIQSQKTEGSTTTSIQSQKSMQNNSTCGSIGIDSTRSRSDQLCSRFSEQIGQLRGLQANSGSIRKPIQCDSTSLCINRPERLKRAVDRSIQPYMGERNPLDPPTYPNDILDFNDTQTVMNYSDCGGILMDYHWTIEPNPESGSEYDSETSPPPTRQVSSISHGYIADRGHELLTRFLDAVGLSRQAQALLIRGQKFQSIRKFYYAMATLNDWMKSQLYTIQYVLRKKAGFIIPEVMAWFTVLHKTPKSSLNKQSCIKTMLQLIFDRELMHDTPSALTYRAISNCNVVTRKYAHVWDIDILFNHQATQQADQMLTNQDLQIKLASLLLSVCILRITEISEIDLNFSNFNFGNHTAQVALLSKTTNALEQYEVRRT